MLMYFVMGFIGLTGISLCFVAKPGAYNDDLRVILQCIQGVLIATTFILTVILAMSGD